jgi:hypothetical protein
MAAHPLDQTNPRLVAFTKSWWFLGIIFLLFALPPYTSKPYPLSDWPWVNQYILTHPIKPLLTDYYWVFKVIPLILVMLIGFFGNRSGPFFSSYAAISYILFAVLQSVSISEKYGLGICTSNLIVFLLIAACWIWEIFARQNDYTRQRQPLWKYWVIIPAGLAFWEPVNPITLLPDFNLIYLLTSGAGLAFCMLTPVYIAILTIIYPRVNLPVLRVTSVIGVVIGLGNMGLALIHLPAYWWLGVMHIPLLSISIYGLVLSFLNASYRKPI